MIILAMSAILAETTDGRWTPGIGDPTPMGWSTVIAYMVTAVLCGLYAWRGDRRLPAVWNRRHRVLWWILALLFIGLGINKQLDLQSWFTSVGKRLAQDQGWYEQRRTVQQIFIVAMAGGGVAVLMIAAWFLRGLWRHQWIGLAGLAVLLCFVVIRAASFHHVDLFLGWDFFGIRMNWLLELGGITCVALTAVRGLSRRRDGDACLVVIRSQRSM